MRKLAFGLIAAAALLVPNIAMAKGGHGGHGGGHGGHGHGHFGHFRHFGGVYFAGGDSCWQYRTVETRRGLRTVPVNVCE
jgi:hypothetical protein